MQFIKLDIFISIPIDLLCYNVHVTLRKFFKKMKIKKCSKHDFNAQNNVYLNIYLERSKGRCTSRVHQPYFTRVKYFRLHCNLFLSLTYTRVTKYTKNILEI